MTEYLCDQCGLYLGPCKCPRGNSEMTADRDRIRAEMRDLARMYLDRRQAQQQKDMDTEQRFTAMRVDRDHHRKEREHCRQLASDRFDDLLVLRKQVKLALILLALTGVGIWGCAAALSSILK